MRLIIIILISILPLCTCISASKKENPTTYKQHIEENHYLNDKLISNLTYNDLLELSKQAEPHGELKEKVDTQLSTAYTVNSNYNEVLNKPYLRVAQWNIKRGFNINAIYEIFTNPRAYEAKYINKVKNRNKKRFINELYTLASSDIICLNEVDIGLPRTEYKNIVTFLANGLKWNYTYVTEFIEVGPIFQKKNVDKELYKGLHVNAIISRFPIVSAKIIRLPKLYNWYEEEVKKRQSPLEHIRKLGARVIFSEHILHQEVRHGSRQAIVADVKLPTDQVVTVVITHLENRAYPSERLKQFKLLLENLKHIKYPIVLTGDFNTSTVDTKPTSFQREVERRIRDPHFFLRTIGSVFIPGLPIGTSFGAVAVSKLLQYKDPFFPSIPIIFPNHERKLFTYLKRFKFNDGYGFDLSGDKKRSSNHKRGLLANSNQRHWKGFSSTFKLEKPRVIAYFKLDWFFIKPIGNHFIPFNGKTLKILNYSFPGLISDHNPITVDIKL